MGERGEFAGLGGHGQAHHERHMGRAGLGTDGNTSLVVTTGCMNERSTSMVASQWTLRYLVVKAT